MFVNRLALILAASCAHTALATFGSVEYPSLINAGSYFQLSVTSGDTNTYGPYRVYLATTPSGYAGGPSCLLSNTTAVSVTSLTLKIPMDIGPNADDYSILIRQFSADGTPGDWTNGSEFQLIGSTVAAYSEYETHLDGAALWPADDLPCSSYSCARACAEASYPGDLTYASANYTIMGDCVSNCTGVVDKTVAQSSSESVAASPKTTSSSSSSSSSSASGTSKSSSTKATGTSATASTTEDATAAATSSSAAEARSCWQWQAPLLVAGGAVALML